MAQCFLPKMEKEAEMAAIHAVSKKEMKGVSIRKAKIALFSVIDDMLLTTGYPKDTWTNY